MLRGDGSNGREAPEIVRRGSTAARPRDNLSWPLPVPLITYSRRQKKSKKKMQRPMEDCFYSRCDARRGECSRCRFLWMCFGLESRLMSLPCVAMQRRTGGLDAWGRGGLLSRTAAISGGWRWAVTLLARVVVVRGPRPLIHKQEIGREVASKEETPVPGLHYVERIPRWSYKEY